MVQARKNHSFLKFFLVLFLSRKRIGLYFIPYINLQTSSENAAGSSRGSPAMSRAC